MADDNEKPPVSIKLIHSRVGRPASFTQSLADKVCERLGKGEPLARICDDPEMPSYTTVIKWENEFPDFALLSTRAKQNGTHWLADDCLRISDDQTIDPANKRIMIDTRLRLIGKWHRKAYGDKVEVEQNTTVQHVHVIDDARLSEMEPEELAALADTLAFLSAKDVTPVN